MGYLPLAPQDKTTAALIFATQLARGAPVAVIDADPNHPIENWTAEANAPNMNVIADADEENILERIEETASPCDPPSPLCG